MTVNAAIKILQKLADQGHGRKQLMLAISDDMRLCMRDFDWTMFQVAKIAVNNECAREDDLSKPTTCVVIGCAW